MKLGWNETSRQWQPRICSVGVDSSCLLLACSNCVNPPFLLDQNVRRNAALHTGRNEILNIQLGVKRQGNHRALSQLRQELFSQTQTVKEVEAESETAKRKGFHDRKQ